VELRGNFEFQRASSGLTALFSARFGSA